MLVSGASVRFVSAPSLDRKARLLNSQCGDLSRECSRAQGLVVDWRVLITPAALNDFLNNQTKNDSKAGA